MKKVLIRILISISIIYLVFSLGYNIIYKGMNEERLEILEEQSKIYNQTAEYSFEELSQNYTFGRLSVINANIIALFSSFIIGGIIGLLLSLKENSKVKYILYFILGIIIYNIIWTVLSEIIYSIHDISSFDFYSIKNTYIEVFKKTFLSYILLYGIILVGNIINNKVQVNNLNENLNKKIENRKQKTININDKTKSIIKKVILVILIVIFLIITIIISRRVSILINYSKVINEISKTENYYIKEISKSQNYYRNENGERLEENNYISEIYYKDGRYVSYANSKFGSYADRKEMETISINEDRKKAYINKEAIIPSMMRNNYYTDSYVRTWQNIALSFHIKISIEEVDNSKCYVITYGNEKLYIDYKTYMPVMKIYISTGNSLIPGKDKMEDRTTIGEIKYNIIQGVVKDEDIIKPDLSGYTIVDMTQKR